MWQEMHCCLVAVSVLSWAVLVMLLNAERCLKYDYEYRMHTQGSPLLLQKILFYALF
jgi:hypothetical protein